MALQTLPALVDLHVHLRDPGQTHKEDIFSGARAAAVGGVRHLCCMPNTLPPCDSPAGVRYILEKAAGLPVHIYPVAAITKGLQGRELTDFAALKAAGAVALSDDGQPVRDAGLMKEALLRAKEIGLPVFSHCEIEGQPEAKAVERELSFGLPVHICHVSTWDSVELLRAAKRAGLPVTAETAPHYCVFTREDARDADFKMNPPLGTKQDREAVKEAVADGTIDCIATDHAPHAPEEKHSMAPPNGVIGLETSLAVCYTVFVKTGMMSMDALMQRMSLTPARIIGITNTDTIVFDDEEEWTVDPEKMRSKSRNTPFKGMTLTGRVKE